MASGGEVRVLEPGLLTTIQDAAGRPGLGRFGIPPGGAMDARAARLANRLVGGGGEEAVLEITLQGPALEWATGAHIALAGADLGAASDGRHLAPGHSHRLAPRAVLSFGVARSGARAYLAVQGGFEAATVLGSVSTDRRSGFGGLDGRALRAGDVLRFAGSQDGPLRSAVGSDVDSDEPLAFIPTEGSLRSFGAAAERTFCATEWRVAPDSDRNGIRLTGGVSLPVPTSDILSLPRPGRSGPGAAQRGADHQDGRWPGHRRISGARCHPEHRSRPPGAGGARHDAPIPARLGRRRPTATSGRMDARTRIELDEGDVAAGWAR